MKHSKNTFILIVGLVANLLLFSCQPLETDYSESLLLDTEGFKKATKTTASGVEVHWSNGDVVLLNGDEYTVEVNASHQARVTGFGGSGAIRGYYPASLPTSGSETDAPTVSIPGVYSASYSGGQQEITLPMVAKASAGATTIMFRHLTSAVQVRLRNDYSHSIYLDSVVVESDNYQLCGSCSVDLTDAQLGVTAQTSGIASQRRVRVEFERNATSIGAKDIREVQVPILPIGEDNLTIKVYAHSWLEGVPCDVESYSYSHRDVAAALARNELLTAQIALRDGNSELTAVERGAFTVSESKNKVYFSQGNLQYTIATGVWSFLENQYDVVETGDVSENYGSQSSVGLFGWGTNGVAIADRITSPTATSTDDASYGPATGNLTQAQDWGHNPIANGGNKADWWRTLTYDEWNYLLNIRKTMTNVGVTNARYARAKVEGVNGIILIPDNFQLPASFGSSLKNNANKPSAAYNNVNMTSANWKLMQDSGAIFIPVTKYRTGTNFDSSNGNGYYWTSTRRDNISSRCFVLSSTKIYPSPDNTTQINRHWGCAVRLVRDAK